MGTPAYQSFGLMQGQDKDLEFTITDASGNAQDFTGMSGRFVAGRSPNASSLNLDSDASPQTATVDLSTASPIDGLVTVSLADTVLDSLSGDYYYELKLTDASNDETVAARGWISIAKSIS